MTFRVMRSPILLLAAAQVMVARTPLAPRRADGPCGDGDDGTASGLRFVQHVGYWSHYDARLALSSWPFDPTTSLLELAMQAERWGIDRPRGEAGDLVLKRDMHGLPARVGIVLQVEERAYLPPHEIARCQIAWGLAGWGARPRGEVCREWVSPVEGDRFLAWYEAPDDYARHRSVA